jgi:hypothetical protein
MPAAAPIALGNVHANGKGSQIAWSSDVTCRHDAVVNIGSRGDVAFVPSLDRHCAASDASGVAPIDGQIGASITHILCSRSPALEPRHIG